MYSNNLKEKVVERLSESLATRWRKQGLIPAGWSEDTRYWHNVVDISKDLNVSKFRVRKVLNKLVTEGLVKREVKERSFPLFFIYYLRDTK